MMTLEQAQRELQCHNFDFFVENLPSMAQGGKGITVPGCPACGKRLQTVRQFVDHLADDVLPEIFRMREVGEEG